MPTEYRKLTFSLLEIESIISAYDARAENRLSKKKVIKAEILIQTEPTLVVHCSEYGEEFTTIVEFDASYVGAALVWFCIDANIPIPRKGSRSLMVSGDGLSLGLYIDEPLGHQETRLSDYFSYDFFG